MSRKIQLSIPKPCHEDWNAMTPAASGRFCASCSKEVIDFSDMSDAQLIQFFKEPRGSVCGRFQQQQLAAELVIPKKRIPWLRYFFTISLPALLYSCKPNWITGEPVAKPETTEVMVVGALMAPPIIESIVLKGDTVIINEGATTGMISVAPPEPSENRVKTNEVESQLIICPPEIKEDSIITKTLDEVVVQSYEPHITGRYTVGGVSSYTVKTTLLDTIKTAIKNIADSIKPSLRLYPNPLSNGLPLKIDWNGCKPGVYHMQLVNMLGQVIHMDKLSVNAKSDLLTIHLPSNRPGAYILTFQNANAFITYSHKLVIQ